MKISIVIIGYNSAQPLHKLLLSLNKVRSNANLYEIIYVDDGSTDDSMNVFTSFSLNYNKQHFQFNKNYGRVFATNQGIKLAKGDWVLLLQSNVVVQPDIINEYVNIIKNFDAVAYSGTIHYTSLDSRFQKYLNHPKRGLNSVTNMSVINYENLLFGNCIIKKSLFQDIPLNLNLKHYGGEELDFAYRLNSRHHKMFRYCKKSIVTRENHPTFKKHLVRLFEFGSTNLNFLEYDLQKKVVSFSFLLNKNLINKAFLSILFFILITFYNLKIKTLDFHLFRGLLFCSMLRGYYFSK